MEFRAKVDFYGIDNTHYRAGSRINKSENALFRNGKVMPEIKHLEPISGDAVLFIKKHTLVADTDSKEPVVGTGKARAGRGGRSVTEPVASTPKGDADNVPDDDNQAANLGPDESGAPGNPGDLQQGGNLFSGN